MPSILYTVRTTCPNIQVRSRFLAWLSPDHVVELMKGGATSVRIILPDRASDTAPAESPELAERAVVETQYVFPSRKAFDTYVRDHAPALRADSVKHFPPESGITNERQVAEIAAELSSLISTGHPPARACAPAPASADRNTAAPDTSC